MNTIQIQTWEEPLSSREIEIIGLISEGLSNREIAQKLHLSIETIKWYNKQIFKKLSVANRTQAVKKANELALLQPPADPTVAEGSLRLSNLPAQLTSYVGRKKEISEIQQLLKSSRLVVLTGPGGIGKTRLALEVAGELLGNYRDGIWSVELATISEPSLVLNTIAKVLKVSTSSGTPLKDLLKRFLSRKHLLLFIDNFEHLLEAAPLVGELLAAAPKVSVLVTSREPLKVYGEQEYTVQPLSLPITPQDETTDALLAYEAISLFIQRAQAARPGLVIDEEQLFAVARICARLDGLPLAIELAAQQVKIYPPSTVALRLEESLDALPCGPRDLPARQRSLQATMDWSYNLLREDEKTTFTRLSVFCGGGTLEAIDHICGRGLGGNVIEALTSLVDKNLVIPREGPDGELRFKLLQTIREYNRERLVNNKEAQELHRLHAAFFTGLAEEASKEIRGKKNVYWFKRLRAENDNLRAVLAWSFRGGDPIFGMRLIAALNYHWSYNGFYTEGHHWFELGLEKAEFASPELHAGMLQTAGQLAYYHGGDILRSQDFFSQALALFQQLGDERNAAWCLIYLNIIGVDYPDKIHQYIEKGLDNLAVIREMDDKPGMALALNILGELARIEGDYEAAKRYYEECLEISIETGERIREGMQYGNLGFIAYHNEEYQLAEQLIKQGLVIFKDLDINYQLATSFSCLAGPTAELGRPQRAARLLGAANAQMETLGSDHHPADQGEIRLFLDTIRDRLGEKEFQEAWREGQRMTIQEAVAYALEEENK